MSKNQDLGELINGIKSLGTNQLNAPAYTSATSFTGTLAGLLGFDSSGNIITTAPASIGVTSFNTRTGAVTLSGSDVTGALGYTPYNATNPSGYISGITSGMVTSALGYTPYDSSNPAGYITSAALGGYVPTSRTLTINGVTYDLSANRSWSISGTSQWTTSGSNIYYNTGSVGIGTSSPNHPLSVKSDSAANAVNIIAESGGYGQLSFSNAANSAINTAITQVPNSSTYDMYFSTYNGFSRTTKMVILGSGNVGVGTTSPLNKFTVLGVSSYQLSDANDIRLILNPTASGIQISSTYNTTGSYQPLIFLTSDTERMRITAAGNVGIGNTGNASRTLEVSQPSSYSAGIRIVGESGGSSKIQFIASGASSQPDIGPTSASPNDLIFGAGGSERMRITAAGAVVIGTTSPYRNTGLNIAGVGVCISTRADSSSGGTHVEFVTLGGQIVGAITTNSSNTTYSTSSDYRLKYDYQDLQALDLIDNLKIYQYKWKVDNAIGYGVLAHELQEYLPYAVTGQKDGDEMQAVDYSKLAPIAIAGVKQLNKLFESHAEKIARLESEVAFLKSNIA